MTAPTLTAKVDWFATDAFSGPFDSLAGRVLDCTWRRGRSADFGAESVGGLDLVLDNSDGYFDIERNWHDNPSFEVDTGNWYIAASSGNSAATSLTRVSGGAVTGSSYAGELTTPATSGAGCYFALPYAFRKDVSYTASVYLKSISGTTSWKLAIGSDGTWTDSASTSITATGSWVRSTVTWTPTADRTDAIFVVKSDAASAGVIRIDAAGVNVGSSAYAYLEAPTRGMMVSGKPVYVSATYSSTEYPQFFGYLQRVSPDTNAKTVTLTAYDVLGRMAETDAVLGAYGRTARESRVALLQEFESGSINFVANPEFATDTASWSAYFSTSITRNTSGGPPPTSTYATVSYTSSSGYVLFDPMAAVGMMYEGKAYTFSVYLRSSSGLAVRLRVYAGNYSEITVTPTAQWKRYSVSVVCDATGGSDTIATGVYIYSTSATSYSVDVGNAALTRGAAARPYSATGTGIYPNLCMNGSFEARGTSGWSTSGSATIATTTSSPYTGLVCLAASLTASTDYVAYSMSDAGAYMAPRAYTASVWLKSSTATASATIGFRNGTSVYGTATASVTSSWQQFTVTHTPASQRLPVSFFVAQNDAVSRTVYVDDVRIIGKSTTDTPEPSNWSLPYTSEGSDVHAAATYTGDVAGGVATLNALALTRHIVPAISTAPYYKQVAIDRSMFNLLTIAETVTQAESFTNLDVDRASADNVVFIEYGGTSKAAFNDSTSVRMIGASPSPRSIGGSSFYPSLTLPNVIGPAFVARYGMLRARPRLVVVNSWPNQLQRELEDLVRVQIPAWKIDFLGTIQSIETHVSDAGQRWTTTYILEQYPDGIARP